MPAIIATTGLASATSFVLMAGALGPLGSLWMDLAATVFALSSTMLVMGATALDS